MFVGFTKKLYEGLVEKDFVRIANVSDRELTEETEYLSLIKQSSSVIYIINIINGKNMDLELYKRYLTYHKENIVSGIEKLNIKYIVMLNLVVLPKVSQEFLDCFLSQKEFEGEEVYIPMWLVDLEEKRCFSNGAEELIQMKDLIYEALTAEEVLEDVDLDKLKREVINRTAIKPKSKNVYITYFLMLLNSGIFIAMLVLGKNLLLSQKLLLFGANSREYIIEKNQYWRLLSAVFLHVNFTHLLSNEISLYFFGIRVEKYMGKLKFIIIYLVSGIFGNILSMLFNSGISAGASGAIYGLIGAVTALAQQKEKKVDNLSAYIAFSILISGSYCWFYDTGDRYICTYRRLAYGIWTWFYALSGGLKLGKRCIYEKIFGSFNNYLCVYDFRVSK